MRFRPYLSRRQTFLFLILIPCFVLVALGLRMMEQERQLEGKRLTEERQRLIEQVRQELLSQLEKIRLQQVTKAVALGGRADSLRPARAVAFVGALSEGQLQLPWENSSKARKFRESLDEGSFAGRVREAEAQDLVAHQYESAAHQYRGAIDAAKEPSQQSYARLLLAHALEKSGRRQESQREYERGLASPPDLVDEHDVPLGLYAARPLLEAGSKRNELIEWIRRAGDRDSLFPPVALYMARDLAEKLGVSESVSELNDLIRDREQAEALQRDFARVMSGANASPIGRSDQVMPAPQSHEPVWVAYGEPVWLTSLTPPAVLTIAADTFG